MPVRPERNQIPIIRGGVERFLLHCEAAGQKSLKDHVSLLRGSTGRVTGRAAKCSALAQSELGGLRFGTRMTAFLLATFYAAMVAAALAVEIIFSAANLIPSTRSAHISEASVGLNYTTILNIIFLTLAAVLVTRFVKTGGLPMLGMMDTPSGDAPSPHSA